MERIIASALMDYLENNNILSECQYGFRAGRSTEDQLLIVYDDITRWYDQGYTVDLLMFDFSKVFDVVNHDLLGVKLELIGITGKVLHWIKDFLRERTMSVKVENSHSDDRSVDSGVPQGSVLGPILFLIFVNFVCSSLNCKVVLFADDFWRLPGGHL